MLHLSKPSVIDLSKSQIKPDKDSFAFDNSDIEEGTAAKNVNKTKDTKMQNDSTLFMRLSERVQTDPNKSPPESPNLDIGRRIASGQIEEHDEERKTESDGNISFEDQIERMATDQD